MVDNELYYWNSNCTMLTWIFGSRGPCICITQCSLNLMTPHLTLELLHLLEVHSCTFIIKKVHDEESYLGKLVALTK